MRYFLVAVLLLGLGCTQGNETPEAGFREGSNAYWRGDYNAALRHLMPAAEAGHPRAQEILGVMYRHGRGVGQDYGEAIKWYCRAAVQGDGRALSNLGFMYRRGMGVPQDNVEAVKWYRMAADIGNAGGQINMGFRYLDGEGIPEDHPSAYLWFSLAAKQDFDGARRAEEMRQETEKMLWPDQLKAAKIAVRVGSQSLSMRLWLLRLETPKLVPSTFNRFRKGHATNPRSYQPPVIYLAARAHVANDRPGSHSDLIRRVSFGPLSGS